mgnify:FL=1
MALAITKDNFEEISASQLPVVIDFWAEWCGPCRMISPIIDELAGEYEGRAVIGKCDVDNNDDIVGKFMVRNIPTIVFIKGGQVVDKQVGACTKPDLVKNLENLRYYFRQTSRRNTYGGGEDSLPPLFCQEAYDRMSYRRRWHTVC